MVVYGFVVLTFVVQVVLTVVAGYTFATTGKEGWVFALLLGITAATATILVKER